MMPDAEIKPVIHVVEDEPDVRDALAMLVRSVGYRAQTYPNADEFLARYRPEHAGCLLADVRMPGMSGLELQERLSREDPALPAIIMTGHGDVPMAVRAMKAGALDFIEKPFNDEALLDAIRRALALAVEQRSLQARQAEIATRLALLTPREHEVMEMVADGRSNKEIANALGVSAKTVEAHRARVMEKTGARSLAELVRMVLTANLADEDEV